MSDEDDAYTVGAAAELAGLSVRTLHYYDQIGLARPSSRSPAGYRLYTDADLALLQRVVFYRELGLDLGDIAEILADPDTTDADHLRRQRELIDQRISRLRSMRELIDKELAARAAGISLTPAQRREVFGGDRLPGREPVDRRVRGGAESEDGFGAGAPPGASTLPAIRTS